MTSFPSALSFLESVAGYAQYIGKAEQGSAAEPVRLAVVDSAYVASTYPTTLPKVTFEGEETLSDKRYVVVGDYRPVPSARVVMLPVGHTFVILGSLNVPGGTPPGAITAFGGTTAPAGWLLCDGAAISRTTYKSLFDAIGTAYGVGNGSTTFNVPDLRQRFPLGTAGSGTGSTLGGTGGTIDHVHNLDTSSSFAKFLVSTATPYIRMVRKTVASWTHTHETSVSQSLGTGSASQTLGIELGGDSDVANPPFQTVNFIVKT